ncbi:GyrI-like domain-containing protein [Microbacterium sp. PAMC22086]|uniref:GyrI-like domain-containing protein n=1 Tax=Microbacterium sp. PAMC22086 TaxID=2861281 RepID=UPI001C6319D1|nr:GyrI-like domain-containing protein [Microbacterium sp. PAMC22086]QYG11938.1 GyrI-like domain-containing protein [Microbacterium sp. PAMC22086]
MVAIDPKKTLDAYRAKRGEFRIVEVPPLQYLMIDGAGDPNTSPAYRDAVSALFPVAYALKFASRSELGVDTVVMPLEGLWHAPDMESFTSRRDKSAWMWTSMTMVGDHITASMFAHAVESVAQKAAKKKEPIPALDAVRLETLEEGTCVQTLHVGPFDDEGPVLDDLHHRFIPENGLQMRGRHHEIYLSDLRRTDPAKLRTILRQPVTRGV